MLRVWILAQATRLFLYLWDCALPPFSFRGPMLQGWPKMCWNHQRRKQLRNWSKIYTSWDFIMTYSLILHHPLTSQMWHFEPRASSVGLSSYLQLGLLDTLGSKIRQWQGNTDSVPHRRASLRTLWTITPSKSRSDLELSLCQTQLVYSTTPVYEELRCIVDHFL